MCNFASKSWEVAMKDNEKTSAYHLNYLKPERITFARELRGLTKKALAEKIQKSPAAITQFESGMKPDVETLVKIAGALEVPLSFFSAIKNGSPTPTVEEFHFRARASVTQMMKYESRRYAERVIDIFSFLEDYGVEFPADNITPVQKSIRDGMSISDVSALVRSEWGLQNLPIRDLFPLLEQNGIFIILLDQEYNELEACATWFGNRPCIMLAYKKFAEASSRVHFDLAHELGHLFLHDESCAETTKEPQAHEFASSFLMPAESYAPDSPKKWHLGMFIDVKRKWRVSLQAALRRSRDLGLITDSSYRWGMVDISKKGYRQKEPAEFPLGHPSLLARAVALVKDHLTLDEFAEAIHAFPDELESILRIQGVDADTIQAMKRQHLVKTAKIVSFIPRRD